MDSARQVGPYTIETEIGRGGMGVVYRGRDSRLERAVAIKTVPPSVVSDEASLSRFVREARLLAGLSHPNIATVYGLEQDEAGRYLVMELVDGEPLSQRVARGRLPVQDALSVAAQIAAGVEAAHDRGIIHRDLKPGNVMIAADGTVKVLDFGLARESGPPGSGVGGGGVAQAVTVARDLTQEGIAVGTPGYMSPEQARGQEVDRRTDVFALGCVLFECLSGSGPFAGRTRADSIAATLDREPEWALLPERTPARVLDLLEHCLRKDVKRRLRDVGDARLELERAIERREWATSGTMRAAGPARRSWKGVVPWVLSGVALAGLAVTAWRARGPGPEQAVPQRRLPVRFLVNEPEVRDYLAWDVPALAISDDGSMAAFNSGPAAGVFIRRFGEVRPIKLDFEESATAHSLLFSPNGRWLAYTSGFSVYHVPVDGGQRVRLFQGDGIIKGFCWAPRGLIVSSGVASGLSHVDTQTGARTTLTTPDRARGEASHRWPDLLPDGRHVLFTIKRAGIETFDEADIAVLDMQTGQWRVVLEGGTYARYVPTGHIIYARAGGLLAAPFDAASGRVTATPIEVMRGVTTEPGSGAAQFALSRDAGTLVFAPGAPNVPLCDLVRIGLDGTETRLNAPARNYSAAKPSPDGRRIAAHAYGATDAIFVYDLDRGTMTRVTFEGNASNFFWSRDGRRIVFTSDREGEPAAYQVSADGSGEIERLSGRLLAGTESFVEFEGHEAILTSAPDGVWVHPPGEEPRRLVSTPMPVLYAIVSPDQRWLAYTTHESGQAEVYVRPFPSGDGRWQVSIGGGTYPQWLPGSDGVVYRQHTNPLLVARWATSPADARSEVFSQHPQNLASLEVLPDASGFVVVRRAPTPTEPWRVEAVLNWLESLRERVPTR